MNPYATCEAPPARAELIARLIVCVAALSLRADRAHGERRAYYADRAEQCRKWICDLREGRRNEDIAEGLAEFEALAL